MRPKVFIGSSKEFLLVANAMREELEREFEVVVWNKDVFPPGSSTLETLVATARRVDAAILIFGPDDLAHMRDTLVDVPRDNVVLEYGLFMGAGDRRRCFFVIPAGQKDFHTPSDLAGVTAGTFDRGMLSSDPRSAIKDSAEQIKKAIRTLQDEHGLSGSWSHVWTAPDGTEHPCELELLQLGDYVRGTFTWADAQFELRGAIEKQRYLNATYRATKAHGYSGTLHMVISPKGALQGKWAGWSESASGVNAGDCRWTRRN